MSDKLNYKQYKYMSDMKKKATPEQIKEYRNMLANLSSCENIDKVNAFMTEYDTMCTLFVENGQTGVKDLMGKVLVPAMFDEVTVVFTDDNRHFALPVIKDGKYGLVEPDGKGTMFAECVFDNIHFDGGYYYTVKDGKKGLFSVSGRELVSVIADKVYEPLNDLIVYENAGKFGFAMYGADVATEAIYDDYVMDENEDLVVKSDGKLGYLDENGNFTEDKDEAWFHSRSEW